MRKIIYLYINYDELNNNIYIYYNINYFFINSSGLECNALFENLKEII